MGRAGRLVVITGPMFSGKTTKLLNEISSAMKKKKRVVLLKAAIDTRYSATDVVSHDGLKLPALFLPEGEGAIKALNEIAENNDVIGIDEGHFWDGTPRFAETLDQLAFKGKTIYISMLNRKNMGDPFNLSKELLPLADMVCFYSARCSKCGGRATFTQRITEYRTSGLKRFVGGAGDYEPRCRKHFSVKDMDQVELVV